MSKTEQGVRSRDLFWRRVAAAAVDVLVLVVVAQVAAIALYAASEGKLRSSTVVKSARCQAVHAMSAKMLEGVAVLAGARPVAAQVCALSMAGFETGRYATVMLQAQEGEVTRSLAFSRPLDRKGLPTTPVILDWVYPLAFVLVMSLAEGLFGATLGKRALGLKVVAVDGGGRLGLARALLRNAVIYGGAAMVLVAPLVAALAGIRLPPLAYYAAVGVFGLLVLAPFAMLAEANPRALYDRWAGADVVRSRA